MSGKPKDGIPFAGWRTDIFDNDTKIDKLLDAQGWVGFSVYFYLCLRASGGDGYFYRWGYDSCASTARKMGGGIKSGTVEEAVRSCLQIGLFDKGLFDGWGILTSKGIQRSYWAALQKRRVKKACKEFWLLEKEECEGLILVSLNEDVPLANVDLQITNEKMQSANTHIGKDRIGKKDIVELPAEPKDSTQTIPVFSQDSFEMRVVDRLIESCRESYSNSKVPVTMAEKQKWAVEVERMKRLDKRTEPEIMQALEYAVADGFWKSRIRSTKKFREKFEMLYIQSKERKKTSAAGSSAGNRFNQYGQREYDFDDLEKRLLSN